MNRIARKIAGIFKHASSLPSSMKYLEHENLVTAYRNGLDWYVNINSLVYSNYIEYLQTLHDQGYTGKEFEEAYKEEGLI